jgi:hypothetical protein
MLLRPSLPIGVADGSPDYGLKMLPRTLCGTGLWTMTGLLCSDLLPQSTIRNLAIFCMAILTYCDHTTSKSARYYWLHAQNLAECLSA